MRPKLIDILAIDDDPWILKLIVRLLEGKGLTVATATSGEDGLAMLTEVAPRLVVVDVNMPPGMDGYEFCNRYREENGGEAPILFLTASGDYPDRVRGLQAGATDYIVKPLEPSSFSAKISDLIGTEPNSS